MDFFHRNIHRHLVGLGLALSQNVGLKAGTLAPIRMPVSVQILSLTKTIKGMEMYIGKVAMFCFELSVISMYICIRYI